MRKDFFNIKTGVIGVGSMGQNHARILSEISNLVGVSDPDSVQGLKIAEKFGVPWFENVEELLKISDAVSIAVPTSFHLTLAEKVIASSTHLLVEKPLSNNSEDAAKIVSLASKKGVILSVGHVERHNPVVKVAKEKIVAGQWGEIISMSSCRVSNFPSRIHDVGVLFDLAIHDIDICSYLSGSLITSVFAAGGSKKAEHEDHVNLIFNHENGIISKCETNWLTPMKIRNLVITTSTHYIIIDFQNQSILTNNSEYHQVDHSNLYDLNISVKTQQLPIIKNEPLKLELLDFLSAILNSTIPLVSGEDGLEVVRISESAMKSLKTKENIFIER